MESKYVSSGDIQQKIQYLLDLSFLYVSRSIKPHE